MLDPMTASEAIVVVMGAGGRLGSAIAATLASRGASLVLADSDERSLARTRGPSGRRALAVAADLRDERQVEALVARAIKTFGRVDAVVNSAGVEGPVAPLEELSADDLVRLYDVNLFGPFRLLKAVLPHFKERRQGRIVNVASGAGLAGTEYMAAYSSSKHALVGLTRSLAREVAPFGVSANAVCPGCIESPMMERIERELEVVTGAKASFAHAIPAGRYAAPREVAELVAFLALDGPPYLTGAVLVIDGGLRA
jgi:meso-butanediol dehydrogenase / (S,S)-butanediol dehydrogenase / diacetyl reductase